MGQMNNHSLNRRDFIKLSGSALAGVLSSDLESIGLSSRWKKINQISHKPQNIILITMDTVRAQNMSLHGYNRPTTTNFIKLSNRGVTFSKAICNASWTLPSHAAMFTSRYPSELDMYYFSPLSKTTPTVAEYFRENGYNTAGFVGNNWYCSKEYGISRGFEYYEDYPISPWQVLMSSAITKKLIDKAEIDRIFRNSKYFDLKDATQINQSFLKWLTRRNSNRPFFAFLNYFDAHDPYLPPKDYALLYSNKMPSGYLDDELRESLDPCKVRQLNDAYDGALNYLDVKINDLINSLEILGYSDHTLIIITSDHGEQFGEHQLLDHGNSLYMPLLWVPLIIIFPQKIPSGLEISTPVSLINLSATIISLAGGNIPKDFRGFSFEKYWTDTGKELPEEMVFSEILAPQNSREKEHAAMKSIIYKDTHYIWSANSSEELFDLSADPSEYINLLEVPESAELLAQMRVKLAEISKKK